MPSRRATIIGGISSSGSAPVETLQISFAGSQGQQGVAFSASLIAIGGVQPYTFSISSGSLPSGLSLDTATGKISGTPSAAGSTAITGRVTDAASTTADVSATINITRPTGESIASTPSIGTLVDSTGDRWQDGNGAVHAVISVPITLSVYPRIVTIQTNSPQYGRINHGLFNITGSVTIKIGARTTNTSIFPPTNSTSETVTVAVAVGVYDASVDVAAVSGADTDTISVAGPPAPGSTEATGWYITSSTPVYDGGPGGASLFRFRIQGNLPITASDGLNFMSARLCVQTKNGGGSAGGQRPNTMSPTDSKTFVGDYAGPTAFYQYEDHAENLKGDPATGAIIWDILGWTVPSDGYPVFFFELYVSSRRSGGTWTKQNCWSSAAGTSTPGTNSSQSLTVDGTKSDITRISIPNAKGTADLNPTTEGWELVNGARSSKWYPGYLKIDDGGGRTLEFTGGVYAFAGGQFVIDTLGVAQRVANQPTAGWGVPIITAQYKSNGRTTAYNQAITDPGGTPSGLYEVDVALVVNYPGGGTPAGSLTLQVWAAYGSIGYAALTLNLSAGSFFANDKAVCLTDGSTDGSVPVSGIAILSTVGTGWSHATFDVYVSVRKLRGL